MKGVLTGLMAAVGILLVAGCNGNAGVTIVDAAPAAAGSPFPSFELPIPPEESAKRYLGISGEGTFRIGALQAEVLIIEIFSMYCPHCQREAPLVNELYQAIQERVDLKERVKIIGIGAGNSEYEVGVFREKYGIPFPLVPDKDMKVTQAIKVTRTPTFVGVRLRAGTEPEQFIFQAGPFGKAPEFLAEIVRLSGLKLGN